MTGGDKRVEPRRARFQQHRHRGPSTTAGEQHRQIVRHPFGKHGSHWRGCGLKTGSEEDDPTLRILAGNTDGFLRRSDWHDLTAGGARLLQRTHFVFADIDRHAKHVAEGDENDFFYQRKLNGLVDAFLRADADRTSGARHQFDVCRQSLAQADCRDRSFMTAANVHDFEAARQFKSADMVKPLPWGDGAHDAPH